MANLTRMPRSQLLVITAVIIVIAALFANVVNFGDGDASSNIGGWIGWSAFGIAVAALLLLVAVPRVPRDQRRNSILGFGIGALVTVLLFWSMLPFALAAAALYAAGPGEERVPDEGEAPATAGVLLALLAVIAAFVLCIIG